jgi:hypothetical protein
MTITLLDWLKQLADGYVSEGGLYDGHNFQNRNLRYMTHWADEEIISDKFTEVVYDKDTLEPIKISYIKNVYDENDVDTEFTWYASEEAQICLTDETVNEECFYNFNEFVNAVGK